MTVAGNYKRGQMLVQCYTKLIVASLHHQHSVSASHPVSPLHSHNLSLHPPPPVLLSWPSYKHAVLQQEENKICSLTFLQMFRRLT